MDNEIIICSAVLEEDGTVIRGHRHNDCLLTIFNRNKKPKLGPDTQGFVTSSNRFVNRVEGLRLQKAAGIPSADLTSDGEYRFEELYSEDLY